MEGVTAPQLGGQLIGERFEIRERLGVGGMGAVYRAYDRRREVDVALKTLLRLDGRALFQFKQEFRSLADIAHDNLVSLYELQAVGELWFFTMALVDGTSFSAYVRPAGLLDSLAERTPEGPDAWRTPEGAQPPAGGGGPLGVDTGMETMGTGYAISGSSSAPPPSPGPVIAAPLDRGRLSRAMPQVADGIAALHRAGKLHRDIKPSNVLVGRADGRVSVCDFGLVTELAAGEGAAAKVLSGTPGFMSPEQAARGPLTEASDWYGVGVVLYQALTGRLPFTGSVKEVLAAKRERDPEPPRRWDPSVPRVWDELCQALLSRDPDQRPGRAEIRAAFGDVAPVSRRRKPTTRSRPEAPFVGRERELQILADALVASRQGRSVAVFIKGISGMGKSALAREFVLGARNDALILQGRCYERESVPYKALDALVDSLYGHLAELPVDRLSGLVPPGFDALVRLFPVLERVRERVGPTDRAGAVPRDVHDLRRIAFGALAAIVSALARDRTTVVYVDDLQWGDVDSGAWFNALIRENQPAGVLFVATYRLEEEHTSALVRALRDRDGDLGRSVDVREICVEPLTADDAGELARALLEHADEGVRRRAGELAVEAQGSPFLVAELALAAERGGQRAATEGVSLDEVLAERIGDLPVEARRLLEVAAVAGRPVSLALLARVAALGDQPAALTALRAERLIRVGRGADGTEEIETYHDRVRETITARLSEDESRRAHRRLARAFERASRVDPQALVEHWMGAGEPSRAGPYALMAAEQAERAVAFGKAAQQYALALDLLEELADGDRRDLQTRLADALSRAGQLSKAADTYRLAAEGAPAGRALELERRRAEQLLRAGRLQEGMVASSALLRSVGEPIPTGKYRAIAFILRSQARLALRGRALRQRAEPMSELERWRLEVMWSVASSVPVVSPLLGIATALRYEQRALDSGDAHQAALALGIATGYESFKGTRAAESVDAIAAETKQLAEQSGDALPFGFYHSVYGKACFMLGRWRRAYELSVAGARMLSAHCADARYLIDAAAVFHQQAKVQLGELADVVAEVPVLVRDAVERGDLFLADYLRWSRTNIAWLAMDQPERAREQLLHTMRHDDNERVFQLRHYYQLLGHINIDLYQGKRRRAHSHLDGVWRTLLRSMTLRVQVTRIDAHFMRGRVCVAAAIDGQMQLLDAARRAQRAIMAERSGWGCALGTLLDGCILAAGGERGPAAARLREAAGALDDHEMSLHAEIARLRLGQLEGGDAGRELAARACDSMAAQRVASPHRMADTFAPLNLD